jgi:tetratricopeptide (TPR) repeat protein
MNSKARRVLAWGPWLLGLAAAFLIGMSCTGSDQPQPQPQPDTSITKTPQPDDVIDEQLMIALGQAKNFHYKAKVYMSDGKVTEAIAAVRQILSLRFPADAPEADDVRNDARALLARLLVSQNKLDEAQRVVEEGLATVKRESFFVANLYTAAGEIHYARAKSLEPGDPQAATERRAAIEALDKSIQIDVALQKQLESP